MTPFFTAKRSPHARSCRMSRMCGICVICRISRLSRLIAVLAVSAALLLGATACGTGATTTKATTPTTKAATTAASTAPTTTATTKATTQATSASTASTATTKATTSPTTTIVLTEPQLAYVVSVSNSTPVTVNVDYVEMYTGAEAIAKAKQDKSPIVEKDEKGNEFIPNDYYLRNVNPQLRTFPLAAKCSIKVLPSDGGSDPTKSVTAATLRTMVGTRKRLMEITFNPAGTEIVGLAEFFLP